MTHSLLPSWDDFEHQVQACLVHLYDYTFLQGSALVRLLIPDYAGPDRIEAFRNLMIETVERLRPGANVDFHAKASRSYNILLLRYVSQQSTQEVIQHLALSERQFYREHPKAIRSASGILWEQFIGQAIPEMPGEPIDAAADVSVASEIRYLHEHAEQVGVELSELLASAVDSVQILAEQYSIDIELQIAEQPAWVSIDRTGLRQAFLSILACLITRLSPGSTLYIRFTVTDGHCLIEFACDNDDAQALADALNAQVGLQQFLEMLHASLSTNRIRLTEVQVVLEMTTRQQTVLIIDDNPDAVDLLQRYLAGPSFRVCTLQSGAEAVQTARELQPDAIILDIMMPGQDGFELLQNFKNHAFTKNIPVIVCSVLEMQDLALSLRADVYMKKPPQQAELIKILDQWRE